MMVVMEGLEEWTKKMESEVEQKATFSHIRYAQCWEDAEILLEALDVTPQHHCLSIASAGDNTLALLTKSPKKVWAIDLSAAQLHCLALKVAAFRTFQYQELLAFLGVRPHADRTGLYLKCRPFLTSEAQHYWDHRPQDIKVGVCHAGKFETFFRLFRRYMLPIVHSKETVRNLFSQKTSQQQTLFYDQKWNSWRWRWMFKFFFSQWMVGQFGRDPRFFDYVTTSVSQHALHKAEVVLHHMDPTLNPFVQWILLGRFETALPVYLREENFDLIRANLHCLEWQCVSIEACKQYLHHSKIDRFNLSNIFEYVSESHYESLLHFLIGISNPKARLVYWNMMVQRTRPDALKSYLRSKRPLAQSLFKKDKAPFYSRFVIEEVI